MYKRIGKWLIVFLITIGLVTCSSPVPENVKFSNKLAADAQEFRIWWPQGFLSEENILITDLVKTWQKESHMNASLTLVPVNQMDAEVSKALESGNPPDVLYSTTGDSNLFPKLAWENELEDISDIINQIEVKIKNENNIKDVFQPIALKTVQYKNKYKKENNQQESTKNPIYAAPIGQQTVHMFYWRNLLQEAGFKDTDIPKEWDKYWEFWQTVQQNLRKKRGADKIYGVGLPMSDLATDTFLFFEEFLEAYKVKVLDSDGMLIIDKPENRENVIKALKRYTDFYKNGYVPPNATEWKDPGNNISFLEGESIMTWNGTLSIPLTQKLAKNKYNEKSNDSYYNKIVTADLPDSPDGSDLKSILGIKQVVIFKKSKHKDEAFSFLKYLLSPENLGEFLEKGGKGRIIPVMPQILKRPFWTEPDPNFPVVVNQLINLPARPSYEAINPAYSVVLDKNIWGKAILSVVVDRVEPEKAANAAISQIVDIFSHWK